MATETGFRCIDEIRAGDRVWSYNVETGERSLKVVKEVFVRENDELLHIETSRGAIDATTSHPFYVVGKGWVAAGDLAVGDSIQAISGDAGVVTGLELEKLDRPISVYNLDVEDFHSYFVADGVLVHNAGCNNKRVLDETKVKGHKISIDLEMGGSQKPNIHILVDKTKYIWNEKFGKFLSRTGKELPRSLRGKQLIEDALKKAVISVKFHLPVQFFQIDLVQRVV